MPAFGTVTLPAGASGASSRGEGGGLLAGLRHGHPTHRCLRGILAWRGGSSGRSSARPPYPQVPQGHPRVAKGASGRSSPRPPCPQVPQGHPRVAKHHPTGLIPVSYRSLSDALAGPLARGPCPRVPQCHPGGAKHHPTDFRPVSFRCSGRPFGTVRVSDGWSMNR